MQILIDYLVLTAKKMTLFDLQNRLNLRDLSYTEINSYYCYDRCLYYDGIKLHYGGRDDVCLDLSGKGCRTVEHLNNLFFDWFEFLSALYPSIQSRDVHISRIDIACDDFDHILDYSKMVRYLKAERYICKSRKVFWTDGCEKSIYFGSSQSDRRLRIYDKALEMGYDDKAMKWIRVEFQLRNDNALSFLLNWFTVHDIGKTFFGVLHDYLRFLTQPVSGKHHERCITASWWLEFLQGAEKLKQIYCQGRQYDLSTISSYIEHNCSSNLLTLLSAYGGNFAKILELIDDSKITKKQAELLKCINQVNTRIDL